MRGPDRVPLEWVCMNVFLVAALSIAYIVNRPLHVTPRGWW